MPYLHTLGPKVGIIYIHGALGFLYSKAVDSCGPESEAVPPGLRGAGLQSPQKPQLMKLAEVRNMRRTSTNILKVDRIWGIQGIYIYVYIYSMNISIYMYIYIYVSMYICMYMCMCVYTSMDIYIYILPFSRRSYSIYSRMPVCGSWPKPLLQKLRGNYFKGPMLQSEAAYRDLC